MSASVAACCASGSSPLTRGKPPRRVRAYSRARLIPAHAGKTGRGRRACTCWWAHPRSRGENPSAARPAKASGGSSPLTRGKLRVDKRQWVHRRLIPAHAGKTGHHRESHVARPAHPRSRGENLARASLRMRRRGSSPLTRGKRRRPLRTRHTRVAHPRSRGENLQLRDDVRGEPGSSPLTRGKLRNTCKGPTNVGLIPAHAGKTSASHSCCAVS